MNQKLIPAESVESLEDPSREWHPLAGGTLTAIWRSGDIVKWPRGPESDAVVQVLTWLTARGVPAVPELVAVSEQGLYVRYIEGKTLLRPWPAVAKTNDWVVQLGKWLASYHAAIHGFQLRADTSFLWGPAAPEPGMIVCHGDLGPWNFLEKDGRLTGVIDWHLAHFGPPLDNLAAMAIESVPLRQPVEGTMDRDVPESVLVNRLEAMLDAYGGVTAAELLSHAMDYLSRLTEQTEECASREIAPFDEFVKRGFLAEYSADREYIRDWWIRGIRP